MGSKDTPNSCQALQPCHTYKEVEKEERRKKRQEREAAEETGEFKPPKGQNPPGATYQHECLHSALTAARCASLSQVLGRRGRRSPSGISHQEENKILRKNAHEWQRSVT